jgi:hypothetical protein
VAATSTLTPAGTTTSGRTPRFFPRAAPAPRTAEPADAADAAPRAPRGPALAGAPESETAAPAAPAEPVVSADATGIDPSLTRADYPLMKTLNHRCAALTGTVGLSVGCSIYEDRPAACRAFTAGSPLCLEARASAGLS